MNSSDQVVDNSGNDAEDCRTPTPDSIYDTPLERISLNEEDYRQQMEEEFLLNSYITSDSDENQREEEEEPTPRRYPKRQNTDFYYGASIRHVINNQYW